MTIAELEARIAELNERNQAFFAAGTQNTKAHYEIARPLLLARQALYAAAQEA